MRLLFDQNLSHRLTKLLAESFPDSLHVKDINMTTATDTEIWQYAREKGLTIVSKDSDFHQRSFVYGPPPKVIWIQRGNCSTDDIYRIIQGHRQEIEAFIERKENSFLILE